MTRKLRLLLFLGCLATDPVQAVTAGDRLVYEGIDAYKAGNYDLAISKFTEALEKNPKSESAYNDRGLAYREKGNYIAAIADFTVALGLKPGWFLYYNRGTAYYKKGDQDEAISDFTQALKANSKDIPGRVSCLIGRARANFEKEKAAPAMTDLNAAIKLGVKGPDAYVLRGILHKIDHDYGRSLADYEKAISLDSRDARSYEAAAYLLSVCPAPKYRDGKKALAYALKACELSNWKDASHIQTLAAAYAENDQFDAAIRFQTRAAEINPKESDEKRLALYRQRQPFRDLNRKEEPVANLSNIKDKVTIKLGQKLDAQFEIQNGQPVAPKIAPAGKIRPDVLWLDFREDKRGHVLFLWHSFPRSMQLRCLARLKGYDTYFETDLLPVPVKTVNPEIWSEPIDELVLFEFKLLEAEPSLTAGLRRADSSGHRLQ